MVLRGQATAIVTDKSYKIEDQGEWFCDYKYYIINVDGKSLYASPALGTVK